MKTNYSTPIAEILPTERFSVLCQSAGLSPFTGPSDLTDPTDPYNYPW